MLDPTIRNSRALRVPCERSPSARPVTDGEEPIESTLGEQPLDRADRLCMTGVSNETQGGPVAGCRRGIGRTCIDEVVGSIQTYRRTSPEGESPGPDKVAYSNIPVNGAVNEQGSGQAADDSADSRCACL